MRFNFRKTPDQRTLGLLRAAFHPDLEIAKAAADRWFEREVFDQTVYDEHEALSIVFRRHAKSIPQGETRQRLAFMAKQIWMRKQESRRAASAIFDVFEDMLVPWVLVGRSGLSASGRSRALSTDVIEILVDDSALSFVANRLWDHGWLPPEGSSIYSIKTPTLFAQREAMGMMVHSASDLAQFTAIPKEAPLTGRMLSGLSEWQNAKYADATLECHFALSQVATRWQDPLWWMPLMQHASGSESGLSRKGAQLWKRAQRAMDRYLGEQAP